MERIEELADAVYRDKVRRARRLSASRKIGYGAQLFAEACSRMRAGIRSELPSANEQEVNEVLRERLNRLHRVEDHGLFQVASPNP